MRRKQRQPDGRGKTGAGRGLRQPLHPQRASDAHLLAKDPRRERVEAGDLTGPARQHDLLRGQVIEPGGIQSRTHPPTAKAGISISAAMRPMVASRGVIRAGIFTRLEPFIRFVSFRRREGVRRVMAVGETSHEPI